MSAISAAILYFQKNKENNEESNRKKKLKQILSKRIVFLIQTLICTINVA